VQRKWYVGTTRNIERRFNEHKCGKGAEWTKKYEPIEIAHTEKVIHALREENEVTFEYMKKYGVENVRGGSYTKVNLNKEEKRFCQQQVDHLGNQCYKCHQPGHFARDCGRNDNNQILQPCVIL